ncbi:MAG TPA: hypothetical protein DEH78_16680 [Solibacterales bacterium]|nr:hypothetical protein [Bryobacterales bacterium]
MQGLAPEEIIRAWEAVAGEPPARAALSLLRSAGIGAADISIGQRDRTLLALREATFGASLPCYAECPHCGGKVEFTLDAAAIEFAEPPSGGGPLFRYPRANDLAAVAGLRDADAAVTALLERLSVEDGVEAALTDLEAAIEASEVMISLTCPECAAPWQTAFDISSYFATEIAACAKRLLLEVHALASAYGWSEREILSMSSARRRCYLDMVGA